jgi:hypothetical protein
MNDISMHERMYLAYFNDFITVKRFAEYYNLTVDEANQVIEIGRNENHRREINKGGNNE